MTAKDFSVNQYGCSISCLLYGSSQSQRLVLYGHGFSGHKGNRAAARYAEYLLSKKKDAAVLCFDWPCHGKDARKKLTLSDCELYLRCLIDYVHTQLPAARLQAYATSFGGFLFLRYIAMHGMPFDKVALRCPAIPMYDTLTGSIITPAELEKLSKGKDILVGFDRKIKISPDFLESLRQADLRQWDFSPWRDDILILHGTKDEIVPIAGVEAFAARSGIPFFPILNADHRFQDPNIMREAIELVEGFLED